MNAYIRSFAVEFNGRTWDIRINGQIVEGGFFSKGPALAAADWWKRNYRDEAAS